MSEKRAITGNELIELQFQKDWSSYATEIGLSFTPTMSGPYRNQNDHYRNSCEDFRAGMKAGMKAGIKLGREAGQEYDDLKALLLNEQGLRHTYHLKLIEARTRVDALEYTIEKHNEEIYYECQCKQNVGNCDGINCLGCAKDYLIGEVGLYPQDADIEIKPPEGEE